MARNEGISFQSRTEIWDLAVPVLNVSSTSLPAPPSESSHDYYGFIAFSSSKFQLHHAVVPLHRLHIRQGGEQRRNNDGAGSVHHMRQCAWRPTETSTMPKSGYTKYLKTRKFCQFSWILKDSAVLWAFSLQWSICASRLESNHVSVDQAHHDLILCNSFKNTLIRNRKAPSFTFDKELDTRRLDTGKMKKI